AGGSPWAGHGTRGHPRPPWSPAPARCTRRRSTAYRGCWPPVASSSDRATNGRPQHDSCPVGALTTMISVPQLVQRTRSPTPVMASSYGVRRFGHEPVQALGDLDELLDHVEDHVLGRPHLVHLAHDLAHRHPQQLL